MGTDLDLNWLQRLLADNTSRQGSKLISSENIIRVTVPDLDLQCLQTLSADNTSRQGSK